jgi:glucuronate isomerase
MLYPRSPLFNRLLDQIQTVPVIDCHEHMLGPEGRPPYKEPITALIGGYIFSDLESAAFGVSDLEFRKLGDAEFSTDEKWPLFQKLWRATEHTAYARVTKLVLKNAYAIEGDLNRAALERVADKLSSIDEGAYFRTIDQANILIMLVDVLGWLTGGLGTYLDGKKTFPEKWRPMISLPGFHPLKFDFGTVSSCGLLADKNIT